MTRCLAAVLLFTAFFLPSPVAAHELNPAVVEKLTGQTVDKQEKSDPRGEERTFASFPEWYIVYSAQEYAEFAQSGGRPSQFPYFGATRQYWDATASAKEALGTTTLDSNTSTVLRVIGASFSVEYVIIGLYENTVGWASEWLNFLQPTVEDRYASEVAYAYGQFLTHTPWYAFPYGEKLRGLWSTFGWSSLTPRGVERRVALTLGYTLKGAYGFVLGKLSQSSLGSAELTTSFVTADISAEALESAKASVREVSGDGHITAEAQRYRAFTHVAEAISEKGGTFLTIEGHQKILLTVLAPTLGACLSGREVVFALPVLTQPHTRYGVVVPVSELSAVLRELTTCGLAAEHVYDY